MFRPDDIQARLRERPFRPLRLIVSEGLRYDIVHPDLVLVGQRDLTIGSPSPANPQLYDRLTQVPTTWAARPVRAGSFGRACSCLTRPSSSATRFSSCWTRPGRSSALAGWPRAGAAGSTNAHGRTRNRAACLRTIVYLRFLG